MSGAPSAWRSLRPCEVTSRVCGHVYSYLVSSKASGRNRESEISYLESIACVDCRDAEGKAAWARELSESAERGWTRHQIRCTWVHTCRREVAADHAPEACVCEA